MGRGPSQKINALFICECRKKIRLTSSYIFNYCSINSSSDGAVDWLRFLINWIELNCITQQMLKFGYCLCMKIIHNFSIHNIIFNDRIMRLTISSTKNMFQALLLI